MKHLLLFTFLLLIISCQKEETKKAETLVLSGITSRDEAENQAVKKLYDFYSNSNKNLEFYEIESKDFNFILNYYPNKKALSLSIDICSGWLSQYKQVGLDELKNLSLSNSTFSTFDKILVKETDSKKWEQVRTNGCGGY